MVDHMGDAADIDTASSDIGGDQDVNTALAESLERLLAGSLVQVAVANRWAARLVRQKIIARLRPSACRIRATTSGLSRSWAW